MSCPGPGPESRRPRPVRCEGCGAVLVLAHPFDVRTCLCGAVSVSGRPWRPTVTWLSRPGGGWSEVTGDDEVSEVTDDGGDEAGRDSAADEPARRLGYSRPRMAVPVEEIHPPVALTQARWASGT